MAQSSHPTERDPLLLSTPAATAAGRLGPLQISRSTRWTILLGIWTATFLSSLNTTLVATLLPSISSDFNRANQASWLGTSYLLATCTFTPLYGRLCNVLGRRGANQTAVFFAAAGTLACGCARTMPTLVAARFLAGIGGGGILTTGTIIVSDMYSVRSRGLTQGVASIFNSAGMGLGGPLGGFIADRWGWRWAFIVQLPLFAASFLLTSVNLRYTTPGRGKNVLDVIKRIDYGGSATLLGAVGCVLVFLSTRYNEDMPWSSPSVYAPLLLSLLFFALFLLVELRVAREPVLAPFLLRARVPLLIGASNFLVSLCNFSFTYFFPMWFQTVGLEGAGAAGLHLLPNSLAISFGSIFAGWLMHVMGRYKLINLTLGILPFVGATLVALMREDSPPVQKWLSIVPLGFGNAVVLQTMLIALLVNVPESAMAVGTGFGQLFRGIGQVGGVAISSAIFQSILDRELKQRIVGEGAAETISDIRHSATLVRRLPAGSPVQRAARDAYAAALRTVFTMGAVSTLLAYVVRLPIPDKRLEGGHPRGAKKAASEAGGAQPDDDAAAAPPSGAPRAPAPRPPSPNARAHGDDSDTSDSGDEAEAEAAAARARARPIAIVRPRLPGRGRRGRRRLSTYESADGVMDLESPRFGGSARQRPPPAAFSV